MREYASPIDRAARRIAALGAALLFVAAAVHAQTSCVGVGEWAIPGGKRATASEILSRVSRETIVLIGEAHDNAEHHRWELQMLAELHALHPKMAIGFEMFPRRVQGALDRWVAGELTEEAFLKESDWQEVWGADTPQYLPLFHFARMNRIPMIALNVEREFVRSVGEKGFAAVPAEKREGVSQPAPPSEAYVARLFRAYSEHPERGKAPSRDDPAFRRFVEAQQVWDRAMAEALVDAATRLQGALVTGVMGASHISYGYGVPHQLQSLGAKHVASLLPWDANADCSRLASGYATAVFGVTKPPPAPPRQLLGITVDTVPEGVKVLTVASGSIAEAAGLRAGDVLFEVAGTAVKAAGEVRAIVFAMQPGTWLPLKAKRQNEVVDLTAKFPPAKK